LCCADDCGDELPELPAPFWISVQFVGNCEFGDFSFGNASVVHTAGGGFMKLRALFMTAAAVGVTLAATPAVQADAAPPALSSQDIAFLAGSHQSNVTEIASGGVAQVRATCPAVRSIGVTLINDHAQLEAEGLTVGALHGVVPPLAPTDAQIRSLTDVALKSGPDFDRAWLNLQLAAHTATLALAQSEIQSGAAPDVKAVASKTAAVVEHHLHMTHEALATC
jgi:putative membrane protein